MKPFLALCAGLLAGSTSTALVLLRGDRGTECPPVTAAEVRTLERLLANGVRDAGTLHAAGDLLLAREAVRRGHASTPEPRRALAASLLGEEGGAAPAPTENEVQAWIADRRAELERPARVRASLLATERERAAVEAVARLAGAGAAAFAEGARAGSADRVTAPFGGDLGLLTVAQLSERVGAAAAEALEAARDGEVLGPFPHEGRFLVVRRDSSTPPITLATHAAEIRAAAVAGIEGGRLEQGRRRLVASLAARDPVFASARGRIPDIERTTP